MYANKIPKSEQPDKGPYTILNFSHLKPDYLKDLDYYQVISIDPAEKNFAIRISRRWVKVHKIDPLIFIKENFKSVDGSLTNLTFQRMVNFLLPLREYFLNSNYILIERQLHINYRALRINCVLIGFILNLISGRERFPLIIEIDPKLKGEQLGAPKGLNKLQLKKWSVEKCIEILEQRRDKWSLDILIKTKKKDDLADTVCQEEAFFKFANMIPEKEVPTFKIIPKEEPRKVKINILKKLL